MQTGDAAQSDKHKAILQIRIDAILKDYVRVYAREAGLTVSQWAEEVLRRAVVDVSLTKLHKQLASGA